MKSVAYIVPLKFASITCYNLYIYWSNIILLDCHAKYHRALGVSTRCVILDLSTSRL